MRKRIKNYDVKAWAVDFFQELEKVKSMQLKFEVEFMDSFAKSALLTSYANAKKRLMLIDYDGTLVPFSKEPSMAFPNEGLIKLLQQLSKFENNELFIISGRDSATLDKWLGKLNIGLIAEHGAKVRGQHGAWKNEIDLDAGEWKEIINSTMERYVAKCPNSFVEHKEYSLAWHYRKADAFLCEKKAAELHEELLKHTLNLNLEVIRGNKVIEVRNKGIHKGKAVEIKLTTADYDFILCIGDDRTDEDMFEVLANIPYAYTIKVGHQASFAKYNLHTHYLVLELLETICQYPKRTN
jgi:trehalose 6-phosphate synthase/phosphatase